MMENMGKKMGGVLLAGLFLAGCTQTYPANQVKESIQQICRKEYGIDQIDVKINGRTIGVYLPIKKLFLTDFKEALTKQSAAKLEDLENLFRPSPEALEQVEDVLFSISRVLLSTDRKFLFYTLHATDVEQTGLQLVLVGYVDDIKRVRLWDISREEYRKRVLHEIRLSRASVWHRPVRSFFNTLEAHPSLDAVEPYFGKPLSPELFESLLYLKPEENQNPTFHWRLGELRSTLLEPNQVLVHVPVTVNYDAASVKGNIPKVPSGSSLEYFFVVSFAGDPPRISKIIPLSFVDESGQVQKMSMPEELDIEKDITNWETEFSVSDIRLGDFLAEQLTRRTQALLFADERIHNTFEALQLSFRYHQETPKNYFSIELDARLKAHNPWEATPTALHEDVLHVLSLASHEFLNVTRSYQFTDFEFLQFNLASDPVPHILHRAELELLRRNKADLAGLLAGIAPL